MIRLILFYVLIIPSVAWSAGFGMPTERSQQLSAHDYRAVQTYFRIAGSITTPRLLERMEYRCMRRIDVTKPSLVAVYVRASCANDARLAMSLAHMATCRQYRTALRPCMASSLSRQSMFARFNVLYGRKIVQAADLQPGPCAHWFRSLSRGPAARSVQRFSRRAASLSQALARQDKQQIRRSGRAYDRSLRQWVRLSRQYPPRQLLQELQTCHPDNG